RFAASRRRPASSRVRWGNAGTPARLILGILAGQRFSATLTGDASLRRRPMRRVTEPLRWMGAEIQEARGDSLPLTVRGGRLHPLTYAVPVASAQVKSALLLAGLAGNVAVTLREPYRSRDHTERLFVHLGLDMRERDGAISFQPSGVSVPAFRLAVPGDASSAAFLVAAAALAESGELLIENVGVNPTRTGFPVVLDRTGGRWAWRRRRGGTTCTCGGRRRRRAAASRPSATTGWRWRSPCSAPSREPTCGCRSEPRWRSATRGSSLT